MSKGFSIVECVVYVICLTLLFCFFGELIFRSYFQMNKDIKLIQNFTKSLVGFSVILNDFRKIGSFGSIKTVENDRVVLNDGFADIIWFVKNDNLYRQSKFFDRAKGKFNKSISLIMQDVGSFNVEKSLDKVVGLTLALESTINKWKFQHGIAFKKESLL